jgi:hypothetical protein
MDKYCIICQRRNLFRIASYFSPNDWCDHHWSKWWAENGRNRRERRMLYNEAMKIIKEYYYFTYTENHHV